MVNTSSTKTWDKYISRRVKETRGAGLCRAEVSLAFRQKLRLQPVCEPVGSGVYSSPARKTTLLPDHVELALVLAVALSHTTDVQRELW